MKYVYHHLGLGDHFICNGLVRYLYANHNGIKLFAKAHLKQNIDFMYRDLENLEVIGLKDDEEVERYVRLNSLQKQLIRIGFDKIRGLAEKDITFDQAFYLAEGLPFSYRFDKFYIERDLDKERNLYNNLTQNLDGYIFIHEDPSRGMFLDRSRIRSDLPIITNNTNNLITDYLTVLENATEIHVMQSCFKDMINSYQMIKPKIFLHNYVRCYDEYANSKGVNKFEVIY